MKRRAAGMLAAVGIVAAVVGVAGCEREIPPLEMTARGGNLFLTISHDGNDATLFADYRLNYTQEHDDVNPLPTCTFRFVCHDSLVTVRSALDRSDGSEEGSAGATCAVPRGAFFALVSVHDRQRWAGDEDVPFALPDRTGVPTREGLVELMFHQLDYIHLALFEHERDRELGERCDRYTARWLAKVADHVPADMLMHNVRGLADTLERCPPGDRIAGHAGCAAMYAWMGTWDTVAIHLDRLLTLVRVTPTSAYNRWLLGRALATVTDRSHNPYSTSDKRIETLVNGITAAAHADEIPVVQFDKRTDEAPSPDSR